MKNDVFIGQFLQDYVYEYDFVASGLAANNISVYPLAFHLHSTINANRREMGLRDPSILQHLVICKHGRSKLRKHKTLPQKLFAICILLSY